MAIEYQVRNCSNERLWVTVVGICSKEGTELTEKTVSEEESSILHMKILTNLMRPLQLPSTTGCHFMGRTMYSNKMPNAYTP